MTIIDSLKAMNTYGLIPDGLYWVSGGQLYAWNNGFIALLILIVLAMVGACAISFSAGVKRGENNQAVIEHVRRMDDQRR